MKDANKALFEVITKVVGSAENTLFWSDNQYLLLNDQHKRLKMDFSYGSGKTVIFIEKTKQLAARGERVTFILAHDTSEPQDKQKAYEEGIYEYPRTVLDQEDHFLFQTMAREFSGLDNVQLEFMNV